MKYFVLTYGKISHINMNKESVPKVSFIKPPIPYHLDPSEQQPLGIAYVAAQVRNNGYPISLTDLGAEKLSPEIIEKIPPADIYGITSTFLDLKASHFVGSLIREKFPNSLLVIGGFGPTASPELIDTNLFESYVMGEGEKAFLDVLNDYQHSSSPKQVYVSPPIEDLDNIPFPARDLYTVKGGRIFSFGEQYDAGESTGIITSRGCPFACAYCATNDMWERKVRFRSAQNVVDEIQDCIDRFHIRQFRIQDDNFTLRETRLKEICQGIVNRGLKIYWRCSTSANLVEPDILKLMKEAGCVEISYGAESGDPDILKLLGRRPDTEMVIEATKQAQATGIRVRLFFMIGLPGTTTNTAIRDIEFLKRAKPDAINLAIYTPYPGSDVWRNPEKYGVTILTKDFDRYNMHLYSAENRPVESVISLSTIDNTGLEAQKRAVIRYAEEAQVIHKVRN